MSILCRRAFSVERLYAFAMQVNDDEQYLQLEYTLAVSSHSPTALVVALPADIQKISLVPTDRLYLDLFSHLTTAWARERSSTYTPPPPSQPSTLNIAPNEFLVNTTTTNDSTIAGENWQSFHQSNTFLCANLNDLYSNTFVREHQLVQDEDLRDTLNQYYGKNFAFLVIGIGQQQQQQTFQSTDNTTIAPVTRARIAIGVVFKPEEGISRSPHAPLYVPTRMMLEGKHYASTVPFAHVVHTVNSTIGECMCRTVPDHAIAWDRLPGRSEHIRSLRVFKRMGMFENHDLYLPHDTQLLNQREYLAADGSKFVDRTRLGIVRFRSHNLHTLCIVNGGILRTPHTSVCALFQDGKFEFVDSLGANTVDDDANSNEDNAFIWLVERPYRNQEQTFFYKIYPRDLVDIGQLTLLSFHNVPSVAATSITE